MVTFLTLVAAFWCRVNTLVSDRTDLENRVAVERAGIALLKVSQYKFNVPNLPLFAQGSEPFLGDYIEVVPSPLFVPSANSWAYNFKPSVNPLFHATWTDNCDVVPPANGNWKDYTPPSSPERPDRR